MANVLDIQERNDAVIARPGIARFDLQSTDRLREELRGIDSESKPLLVDLSEVEFLPSATIGTLVELANRCRTGDRPLALVGLRPKVHEVLLMCGLDKLFVIHGSEGEALAALT